MRVITAWEKIPAIFDLSYASCLFGIDRRELSRLARIKKIPAFKIGANWYFRKLEIEDWIKKQSDDHKEAG